MKIKFKDFLESNKKLLIHCDTKEKAQKLCKAFDKIGKYWYNGASYLENNCWSLLREKTCYTNYGHLTFKTKYYEDFTYEFKDVIFDDKIFIDNEIDENKIVFFNEFSNDFSGYNFDDVCKELEKGNVVVISEYDEELQNAYKDKLIKKYGSKLSFDYNYKHWGFQYNLKED